MKIKKLMSVCSISLSTALSAAGMARAAAPKPNADAKPAGAINPNAVISGQLSSRDPAKIKLAVAAIKERLADPERTKRGDAANLLYSEWMKQLAAVGDPQDIADVALAGELALPTSFSRLEYLQTQRVKALLALNRPQEALSAARSLYDVSSMRNMHDALLVIAEALRAAHPNDADIYNRFVNEQIEGAKAGEASAVGSNESAVGSGQTATSSVESSAAQPAPATRPAETILSAITVDPTPYEAAMKWYEGEEYRDLASRGNLLMLAGKPDEAKPLFERAYTVAEDWALPDATENLARVMKAQDGTVGRANAFVLSLRPNVEAKP